MFNSFCIDLISSMVVANSGVLNKSSTSIFVEALSNLYSHFSDFSQGMEVISFQSLI